jgi:hypothetical protein
MEGVDLVLLYCIVANEATAYRLPVFMEIFIASPLYIPYIITC